METLVRALTHSHIHTQTHTNTGLLMSAGWEPFITPAFRSSLHLHLQKAERGSGCVGGRVVEVGVKRVSGRLVDVADAGQRQ